MYISLATSIVVFVLKASGLQSMAKNQGIRKSWIAWIPFLNKWVQCKVVGSHTLFGTYKTDHLFAYLLMGSIATDLLLYIRTPIAIGFLIVIAVFMVYVTYIMFRDFYAQYSKHTHWMAVVAMLCSPLHAILVYTYSEREMREPVASYEGGGS
jgi:hypothetical protein